MYAHTGLDLILGTYSLRKLDLKRICMSCKHKERQIFQSGKEHEIAEVWKVVIACGTLLV